MHSESDRVMCGFRWVQRSTCSVVGKRSAARLGGRPEGQSMVDEVQL